MNKLLKYILAFGLIFVIIVIAMQFLAPTIGNVFCSIDGDWCLYDYMAGVFTCTDNWKIGLPEGKLVVIIPKTLVIGKKSQIIGFAYSPSKYSKDEIDKITQQLLRRLNLRKDEAHLAEIDVIMDVEGSPRISTNRKAPCYDSFSNSGEYLHIDPEDLTVWYFSFVPDDSLDEGIYDFRIAFNYKDVDKNVRWDCNYICNWALDLPLAHVDVLIKEKSSWPIPITIGVVLFLLLLLLTIYPVIQKKNYKNQEQNTLE